MAHPPPGYPGSPPGPPPWPSPPGWGAPFGPPPRKKRTGLIVSLVLVGLVLLVAGAVIVVQLRSRAAASDNAAALQKVITTYADNFNAQMPSRNLAAGIYCDPLDSEQKFSESLGGVVSFDVTDDGKPVISGDHARINLHVTYSGQFPSDGAVLQVLELDKRSAEWCITSFTFNADVVDGTEQAGDGVWTVQQFIWSLAAHDYGSVNNYTCALSRISYGDLTDSTVTWGVVTESAVVDHISTFTVAVRLGHKDGSSANATVTIAPAAGHYCVKGVS